MSISEVGLFHNCGAEQTFEADGDLPPRASMPNVTVFSGLIRLDQQSHSSGHQARASSRLEEKAMIS